MHVVPSAFPLHSILRKAAELNDHFSRSEYPQLVRKTPEFFARYLRPSSAEALLPEWIALATNYHAAVMHIGVASNDLFKRIAARLPVEKSEQRLRVALASIHAAQKSEIADHSIASHADLMETLLNSDLKKIPVALIEVCILEVVRDCASNASAKSNQYFSVLGKQLIEKLEAAGHDSKLIAPLLLAHGRIALQREDTAVLERSLRKVEDQDLIPSMKFYKDLLRAQVAFQAGQIERGGAILASIKIDDMFSQRVSYLLCEYAELYSDFLRQYNKNDEAEALLRSCAAKSFQMPEGRITFGLAICRHLRENKKEDTALELAFSTFNDAVVTHGRESACSLQARLFLGHSHAYNQDYTAVIELLLPSIDSYIKLGDHDALTAYEALRIVAHALAMNNDFGVVPHVTTAARNVLAKTKMSEDTKDSQILYLRALRMYAHVERREIWELSQELTQEAPEVEHSSWGSQLLYLTCNAYYFHVLPPNDRLRFEEQYKHFREACLYLFEHEHNYSSTLVAKALYKLVEIAAHFVTEVNEREDGEGIEMIKNLLTRIFAENESLPFPMEPATVGEAMIIAIRLDDLELQDAIRAAYPDCDNYVIDEDKDDGPPQENA